MPFREVRTEADWHAFCNLPDPDGLSAEQLRSHQPDASLLLEEANQPLARCSLWWTETPELAFGKVGYLGHYAAGDADSGQQLLREACRQLAERACAQAIGPINGNTWQRYRLLSERGSEPVFFLEPDNPDDWPTHFLAAGFEVLAKYYSAINTNLSQRDTRTDRITQRLQQQGITVRNLNLANLEAELRAFYTLSLQSFSKNFLYTPQTEAEFLAQYLPYQPYLDPRLILCVEHHNQLVGYLFAICDWNQKRRGEAVDTIIIKTVAVRAERIYAGLGAWLIQRVQDVALQLGYRRAIFALMHEGNTSLQISRRTAEVFRTYCLYSRDLTKALP